MTIAFDIDINGRADLAFTAFKVGDVVQLGTDGDIVHLIGFIESIEQGAIGGTWSAQWPYDKAEAVQNFRTSVKIGIVIQHGVRNETIVIPPGTRWITDARWAFSKIEWDKPLVEPLPYVPPDLTHPWFRID